MKDKEIKNLDNDEKISEEELNTFNSKLHSIQKGLNTLKSKFDSLIENMKKDDYELQYGLSFFESKQDMMIIYISNLLNYCKEKIEGEKSILDLPFIEDNIKIASLIERIKVIEMKLQHLINKTININNDDKNKITTGNEMDLKPKILSIFKNEENIDEEEEEKEEKTKTNKKKKKIYMVKNEVYKIKSENIDFYENKEDKKKRRRQLDRDKEKIRNSEMMRNLREEMSDNPKMYDNNSNSYLNKYMKEVEKYENEHFVNITVPKKVIKQLKKKIIM